MEFQTKLVHLVYGKMHSVYWIIAVLLAVGSSEICYAGPLHAQCKVEWYDVFSLYTIGFFCCCRSSSFALK